MTDKRIQLGRRGEATAAAYLELCGMQIVARNWRTPAGELDIVAREGRDVVAVEVKTRRSVRHGSPIEAVTPQKLARLRRLGSAWLAQNGGACRRVRVDVVGIVVRPPARALIDHRRGVH